MDDAGETSDYLGKVQPVEAVIERGMFRGEAATTLLLCSAGLMYALFQSLDTSLAWPSSP